MSSIELLTLLNLFKQYSPIGIYQDYYNAFNRINVPWYFPGKLLFAISDTLHNKRVIIKLDDPSSWQDLFDDLCTRFKTVRSHLQDRKDLSSSLKSALEHTTEYCQTVTKAIANERHELFQFLARWGINCLEELNNMINDNLLICGAGPIGLITTYFIQKNIPNLNTVLVEKRKKYDRNYHLLLTEDTFNTLPLELKQSIWGYSKYGCYVLPPPIDAKGYCFINPPVDVQVPDRFSSMVYSNDYFNIDSLTGKRTFKRLMSIPISVLETAMEELIKVKYPQVKIIKPSDDTVEFNCANKFANLFNNKDAIYNYIIDATGFKANKGEVTEKEKGMTLIIKSDLNNIKEFMTDANIDLHPTQHKSRFFSNNEKWHTALLSIRDLHEPDNLDKVTKWDDISRANQQYINDEYKKYTGKDLVPTEIEKINIFDIELKQNNDMYEKNGEIYKFYIGDSACAVHFFSGTGINNGISMATKFSEMMTKLYQSRWKNAPDDEFQKWNTEMKNQCAQILEKSKNIISSTKGP